MIDRDVFAEVWGRLCRRFNRKLDTAELDDYVTYLDASGLTTEEFVAASEAAWATREFFPRPADFLAGECVRGWRALIDMVRIGQYDHDKLKTARLAIPKRAWEAIHTIGGLDVVRNAKDLSYVRREFIHAYEARVQEEALGLDRRKLEETPTPNYLRTSGGQPGRVVAQIPATTR